MTSFCKKRECPASQEILEASIGSLARERRGALSEHFCECEFCRAELEFYQHYPQAKGEPEFQQIPEPLFDLATSLLSRDPDLAPFYRLMNGRDV